MRRPPLLSDEEKIPIGKKGEKWPEISPRIGRETSSGAENAMRDGRGGEMPRREGKRGHVSCSNLRFESRGSRFPAIFGRRTKERNGQEPNDDIDIVFRRSPRGRLPFCVGLWIPIPNDSESIQNHRFCQRIMKRIDSPL